MSEGGELKAIKVTDPRYIGVIGPFINSFLEKVELPGVTYESLYTYLAQGVQAGQAANYSGLRDTIEFWVVTEGNKPVAFAHWFVQGPPSLNSVYCDLAYSWQTKKKPMELLVKEFIRFGKEHRCPLYKFDANNERVFQVLSKHLEAQNFTVNRTERVNSWAVKAAAAT